MSSSSDTDDLDRNLTGLKGADLDLTIPQPVQKEDLHHLVEIPVSTIAETKTVSWAKRILKYSHANKYYERVMVNES